MEKDAKTRDNMTAPISIRALETEKAALEAMARQDRRRMTRMTEVLRELIRAEASRRGLWPADGRKVSERAPKDATPTE